MRRQLPTAAAMLLLFTVLTGIIYPLALTGVAQLVFPDKANGSLVEVGGKEVGSSLIAQESTGDEYFHPRPSPVAYDPRDSGGANLGPTNPELLAAISERAAAYRTQNGLPADHDVPVDAVTGSASGLDPHISVANAMLQAPRIAETRGLSPELVGDLIEQHTTRRALGFLGESGVNVLELNIALDNLET